jgi:uncharacterized protein (TIGR02118 family)
MARLLVIYRKRTDADAFDKHYYDVHVPLVKSIPGLRKFDLSRGPVGTPAGASDVHLIATLYFDDVPAMQVAMASPQGFMGVKDSLLVYDTQEY